MTYIVVNKLNAFEPSYQNEYGTFEEAELIAHNTLLSNPKAVLVVAKVEKQYTAEVVITTADPVTPTETPVE